jgi:predicted RecB family nuclease
LAEARAKDHLSLLDGISKREIMRANNRGIFTVTQYAYTFRARRTKTKSKHRPRRFDLQALAIRDKKIYVMESPTVPDSKTNIYVDIEGDPERDLYYLIGMICVTGSTTEHHVFWADTEKEQLDIATRFLEQVDTYDEYSLFHYGAYETKFLKRLKERFNSIHKVMLNRAIARAFNVLDLLYSTVYFPTYSNGLKEIAGHLGCKWTDENGQGCKVSCGDTSGKRIKITD